MAKRPDATNATPSARARKEPAWRRRFLEGLASTGTVAGGCVHARIARTTAYRARERDEVFALEWDEREERVTERLEETALTLALDGEVKLIEFLLKARRPEVYREHRKIEHTGPEGGPISAEITTVDAREHADATREFLARIAGPDA